MATGVARPRGDGSGNREREGLAREEPDHQGEQGYPDHRRDKHRRDPVRDAGDGGLGGRGVGDHADDLAEGGVLPNPGGTGLEIAGLVDGGGGEGVSRGLVHRDTLPGEGGLVHGALPFQHHAVHGDALPRADHEEISGLDPLDLHLNLFPVLP